MLITPEQISNFEGSESAREAKEILHKMKHGREALTIRQFCTVRDYLLTRIEILTCHRSGVSKNVTVEEFKRAEFKEGKYIIKVLKHKTFRKYGPAQVK